MHCQGAGCTEIYACRTLLPRSRARASERRGRSFWPGLAVGSDWPASVRRRPSKIPTGTPGGPETKMGPLADGLSAAVSSEARNDAHNSPWSGRAAREEHIAHSILVGRNGVARRFDDPDDDNLPYWCSIHGSEHTNAFLGPIMVSSQAGGVFQQDAGASITGGSTPAGDHRW